MRILALLSGGVNSAAAASVLKKRNHVVVGLHIGDTDPKILQLADALKLLVEFNLMAVPQTFKVPILISHAVVAAHSYDYDAISVGLHYSNTQPYATTASVLYMRRLLEYAAPRDSNIRLLTPIYDYTKDAIQDEVRDIGFTDFAQ